MINNNFSIRTRRELELEEDLYRQFGEPCRRTSIEVSGSESLLLQAVCDTFCEELPKTVGGLRQLLDILRTFDGEFTFIGRIAHLTVDLRKDEFGSDFSIIFHHRENYLQGIKATLNSEDAELALSLLIKLYSKIGAAVLYASPENLSEVIGSLGMAEPFFDIERC